MTTKHHEQQIRLDIRRTLTRFVVEGGRTLKVAGTYLPYVLAMPERGVADTPTTRKWATGSQA